MSHNKRPSTTRNSNSKRRRTTTSTVVADVAKGFGAPSEFDNHLLSPQNVQPKAISTRDITESVPSLVSIAISVFVDNIRAIYAQNPDDTRTSLKFLPDHLVPRIFAVLRNKQPEILTNGIIVANFIRGSHITLTGDLPGVNNHTLDAVAKLGSGVHHLELSRLTRPSDELFAHIVSELPELEVLILRGSTKVGIKTVTAIAKCTQLRILNLNNTTPTPASLAAPLAACAELQVLKLAAIPKMTPNAILQQLLPDILSKAADTSPLSKLTSLKFKLTSINDASLAAILKHTPLLKRLDVSSTNVRSIPPQTLLNLQKLSLNSTPLNNTVWQRVIGAAGIGAHLQVLALGAIGEDQSLTLTDLVLQALTQVLEPLTSLEDVSLVGNTKLGITSAKGNGALADFVSRVGKRCKRLNLGGIPRLTSQDLYGLLDEGYGLLDGGEAAPPPNLESLTLSNTDVGDEAAPFIAACSHLEALALENTKFTNEGLFTIIDACTRLASLDLASCRGVRLTDRRRFFEVWEKARNDGGAIMELEREGDKGSGRRTRGSR